MIHGPRLHSSLEQGSKGQAKCLFSTWLKPFLQVCDSSLPLGGTDRGQKVSLPSSAPGPVDLKATSELGQVVSQ